MSKIKATLKHPEEFKETECVIESTKNENFYIHYKGQKDMGLAGKFPIYAMEEGLQEACVWKNKIFAEIFISSNKLLGVKIVLLKDKLLINKD
jgi:hypothetical protein